MKDRLKSIWIKIKVFMKKYGYDGLASLVIWTSPSWLSFFIPSLKQYAVTWLALIVSPVLPMWLLIPFTAIAINYLRKKIWQLTLYIKDLIKKYRMAQEMLYYFSVDEFELILEKGKQMKQIKDDDTKIFKDDQSSKRIKMMTDDWEIKMED